MRSTPYILMATPLPKLPLSVAIITLNEEDRLPSCLASVAFAEDIVVVDAGSHDQTLAIAKAHGARTFSREWRGFGPQKQFAIDQCRKDWVLIVDADEQVSPTLVEELRQIMAQPVCQAYSIPRQNFFFGRWIRHGGWWPDRTTRLFKRGAARMSDRQVHEALEVEGPVGELRQPLVHHPFRDLSHLLAKLDHYSSAGAREMAAQGRRGSIAQAVARAGWAFFYNYLLRGGMFDRGPGLVLAISDAVNVFCKYVKLAEINRGQGPKSGS